MAAFFRLMHLVTQLIWPRDVCLTTTMSSLDSNGLLSHRISVNPLFGCDQTRHLCRCWLQLKNAVTSSWNKIWGICLELLFVQKGKLQVWKLNVVQPGTGKVFPYNEFALKCVSGCSVFSHVSTGQKSGSSAFNSCAFVSMFCLSHRGCGDFCPNPAALCMFEILLSSWMLWFHNRMHSPVPLKGQWTCNGSKGKKLPSVGRSGETTSNAV